MSWFNCNIGDKFCSLCGSLVKEETYETDDFNRKTGKKVREKLTYCTNFRCTNHKHDFSNGKCSCGHKKDYFNAD